MKLFDDYIKVHQLKIEINSEHSFLYDSIMNLIQALAITTLEALHNEIMEQIVYEIDYSFGYRKGFLQLDGKNNAV